MEGSGPLKGHPLADHIALPGVQAGLDVLLGQETTAAYMPFYREAVSQIVNMVPLSVLAEAAVGVPPMDQQFRVLLIGVPPLGLDIGGHRAAYVGTLVMCETTFGHGLVDHIGGALHQTALVGVLNAQDKGAPGVSGDQIGVQRGAQVAHVHIAGGGGGKAGTDTLSGDLRLHLLKVSHIHRHGV